MNDDDAGAFRGIGQFFATRKMDLQHRFIKNCSLRTIQQGWVFQSTDEPG
jgi:hypothetical protein